jgi:hypothetical protein
MELNNKKLESLDFIYCIKNFYMNGGNTPENLRFTKGKKYRISSVFDSSIHLVNDGGREHILYTESVNGHFTSVIRKMKLERILRNKL